jgi:hypothetical protein
MAQDLQLAISCRQKGLRTPIRWDRKTQTRSQAVDNSVPIHPNYYAAYQGGNCGTTCELRNVASKPRVAGRSLARPVPQACPTGEGGMSFA